VIATGPADVAALLDLPQRESKPRRSGLTLLIDGGLPTGHFRDVIESSGQLVDFVKFGWGTSLVTRDLRAKIRALQRAGIDFFFGGTLFERFALQGRVAEYVAFCHQHGCRHVEVSNGTIRLSNQEKAAYVARLSHEFTVVSEVGYKDGARSEALSADDWVAYLRQDLEAGATLVLAEARESGRSGICRPDGQLRQDLVEAILGSGLDCGSLVFEAPTRDLQAQFIRRLGPGVNLANVSFADVIGLETLRLGLRSDTLLEMTHA